MQKNYQTEAAMKNVVGCAREVRLHMRDSRVIFATVLAPGRDAEEFVIRPWGVRLPMTVHFGAVARAVAVKVMLWKQQRSISAAQLAGTFSMPSLHPPAHP